MPKQFSNPGVVSNLAINYIGWKSELLALSLG
jgi:hypothetical protein